MNTITLPACKVEILNGRAYALEVNDLLNSAYWMAGRDDGTAQFLFEGAHDNLAKLADAMGYTIAPKEASE